MVRAIPLEIFVEVSMKSRKFGASTGKIHMLDHETPEEFAERVKQTIIEWSK